MSSGFWARQDSNQLTSYLATEPRYSPLIASEEIRYDIQAKQRRTQLLDSALVVRTAKLKRNDCDAAHVIIV